MCGRYTLRFPAAAVSVLFHELEAVDADALTARFNIAPSQPVLAVRAHPHTGRMETVHLRWGLVPPWADDVNIGYKLINARGETLAEKNAFKHAFRRRRCVLPADGFYEWLATPEGKQPYYITLEDGQPFGLAGLWEHWQDPHGNELESCTIITTRPNRLVSKLHDRMPVILPEAALRQWVDPGFEDVAALEPMLEPYPAEQMRMHPVSKRVNRVAEDSPRLVEPIDEQTTLF